MFRGLPVLRVKISVETVSLYDHDDDCMAMHMPCDSLWLKVSHAGLIMSYCQVFEIMWSASVE